MKRIKTINYRLDIENKVLYLLLDGVPAETIDLSHMTYAEIGEVMCHLPAYLRSVFKHVVIRH